MLTKALIPLKSPLIAWAFVITVFLIPPYLLTSFKTLIQVA